jgi:transcriptional regulator with XRE-family HTH domain
MIETMEPKLRLKEWREIKGVTITGLSRRTGMTRWALYNLESDRCRPQRDTLMTLAKALKVIPHELWAPPPIQETDADADQSAPEYAAGFSMVSHK